MLTIHSLKRYSSYLMTWITPSVLGQSVYFFEGVDFIFFWDLKALGWVVDLTGRWASHLSEADHQFLHGEHKQRVGLWGFSSSHGSRAAPASQIWAMSPWWCPTVLLGFGAWTLAWPRERDEPSTALSEFQPLNLGQLNQVGLNSIHQPLRDKFRQPGRRAFYIFTIITKTIHPNIISYSYSYKIATKTRRNPTNL